MALLKPMLLSISIFLMIFGHVQSFPTEQQYPLTAESGVAPCKNVSTFSTEWFLLNTLPEHRAEINQRALFYTRNTSQQARKLACSRQRYVTIWDIWPKWLYDGSNLTDNSMRCIHNDNKVRTTFYENMSRAYARMARKSATVMHLDQDYDQPPLDGIWGRIELPTIKNLTDIFKVKKINEDRSRSLDWLVPGKSAREVYERAMREVRELFRRAKEISGSEFGAHARSDVAKRSSCAWGPASDSFLDGLW